MSLKRLFKMVIPPIVLDISRPIRHYLFPPQLVVSKEQSADYYDNAFANIQAYKVHYTQSHEYLGWVVLGDRVIRGESTSVLDIGCGPGQIGAMLKDRGLKRYVGLDFSRTAISMAELACPDPEYRFVVGDALTTDLFSTVEYDTVTSSFFLEHITADLEILARIRPGIRTYALVPSFDDPSHVRCFANCQEVIDRYGELFDDFRVDAIPVPGERYYLFEGIKR